MSEKEEKDSNEDKSIAGTQIINLHLSDIFKNIQEYNTFKNSNVEEKKGLIAKIISKAKTIAEKDQMIKIKLNGSYCKYFRIGADEFTQNDAAFKAENNELGTLDERGVFIFSSDTTVPTLIEQNDEKDDETDGGTDGEKEDDSKILVLLKEDATSYPNPQDEILVSLKDNKSAETRKLELEKRLKEQQQKDTEEHTEKIIETHKSMELKLQKNIKKQEKEATERLQTRRAKRVAKKREKDYYT